MRPSTARSNFLVVGAEYVYAGCARHRIMGRSSAGRTRDRDERSGLRTTDERGVIYNPLADRWSLSRDVDVNYMVLAEKAEKKT